METYKFWELDGEQKIDALEKMIYMDSIWIDKHDTQSLAKEIEDGYAVDDHFIFQVEEEGSQFVNVIQK